MLGLDLRDDTPGVPVRRCSCGALLATPRPCRCSQLSEAQSIYYRSVIDLLADAPRSCRAVAAALGVSVDTTRKRLKILGARRVVEFCQSKNVWRLL